MGGRSSPGNTPHAPGGKVSHPASLYDLLGSHLAGVRWDYFITLTWAQPIFSPVAAHHVWGYLRRLRRTNRHRFEFICVVEDHQRGSPHAHILTTGLSKLAVRKVSWQQGRSTHVRYDPRRGAAWYLGGHVLRDDETFISRNLARRIPDAPITSPGKG